jgi:methionyl-tRNA formyltransferase
LANQPCESIRLRIHGTTSAVKIVVLTSQRYGAASHCLPALRQSGCDISAVILSKGQVSSATGFAIKKLRKIANIGVLGALNGYRMRRWYELQDSDDLFSVCKRLCIELVETTNTNGPETAMHMRDSQADLGISLGNSYISSRIFNIPRFGMINVHGERLPEYQNAQSVIWPIYYMERYTGVTIHRVERSIDAGAIIAREDIPILFGPTLEHTVRKTVPQITAAASTLLANSCTRFESLLCAAEAQKKGRKFTTPTWSQYLQMKNNNRRIYLESLSGQ